MTESGPATDLTPDKRGLKAPTTFADAKMRLFTGIGQDDRHSFEMALARANTEEELRELFDYLDQGDMFSNYTLAIALFSKLEKLKLEEWPMVI